MDEELARFTAPRLGGDLGTPDPIGALESLGGEAKWKENLRRQELAKFGTDPTNAQLLAMGADLPYDPLGPSTQGLPANIPPKGRLIAGVEQPQEPVQPILPQQPTGEKPVSEKPEAKDKMSKAVEQGFIEGHQKAGQEIGYAAQVNKLNNERADLYRQKEAELLKHQEEENKLKPKDYWDDKSNGTKVAAALAIAFGGYASAMTGGPNTALQIINGAIDRDIALQKEKYQRAKERGASISNKYSDLLAKNHDELTTIQMMRKDYYDRIKAQADLMQTKADTDKKRAEIGKISIETNALAQEALRKATEQQALMAITSGDGGEIRNKINPLLLSKENQERFIQDPTFGGLAYTKEDRAEVNKSLVSYKGVTHLLDVLLDIAKTPGKSLNPELWKKAEIAATALRGQLRNEIVGPGAVTEYEHKILSGIVADPTKIASFDILNIAKLQALKDKVRNNMDNVASTYIMNYNPLSPRRSEGRSEGPKKSEVKSQAKPGMTTVILDGVQGEVPTSNLETFEKAMKKQGRKVEVLR